MLSWHQPQPRGALPAILKMGGIANRRHQGGGGQRPNARDGLSALADWMGRRNRCNLRVIKREPLVHGAKLLIELAEEFQA
jgi:hypothetical protein